MSKAKSEILNSSAKRKGCAPNLNTGLSQPINDLAKLILKCI